MNIKHYELVAVASEFLKNYEMTLDVPIEFNSRLKRVLGRVIIRKKNGIYIPEKIEMSIDFMKAHPKENIIDVMKHELVHYALATKQLPFKDGETLFESELKKYGIKSSGAYSYLGAMHRYTCTNCNKNFDRKRKLTLGSSCTCSKAPNLDYIGIIQKEYDPELGKKIIFAACVDSDI